MNIPIWPGSSSFHPGETPFGFYDNDLEFEKDADKVAKFCAQRLGYPIVDIELQDIQFYTAFEEAVTVYGNEIYAYKVRENYLSLEGADDTVDINEKIITPTLARIIAISEQYGVEAGSGGNVDWYDGMIDLEEGKQEYDLNEWADKNIPHYKKGDLQIMRVFFEATPAIVRYYDPFAGGGAAGGDISAGLDTFGFGAYSAAGLDFVLMPVNYTIATVQAIEFNDTVRRSNFSFEVHNNKLRIFPIPRNIAGGTYKSKLKIQYLLKSEEADAAFVDGNGRIKVISDVPYVNPIYSDINSVGRSWIFEYTLALCKEMLGYVRGKYQTVPIPGAEVQLNQGDLITAATAEKNSLIERLRGYLDETSRKALLERRAQEAEFTNQELKNVPYTIYIG
jgi:hypothetical protein